MKNILAMSVAKTYNLTCEYMIHAFPDRSPYPREDIRFFIPVGPDGIMEGIYYVEHRAICDPDDVAAIKNELEEIDSDLDYYECLIDYNVERNKDFGYEENCKFVFLFLSRLGTIYQPFKQQIRNTKYFSIDEIPVVGMKTKVEPISIGNAWMFGYIEDDYDIYEAMRYKICDIWDTSGKEVKNKIKDNDVVYLYSTSPEKTIKFRGRVKKIVRELSDLDGLPFGAEEIGESTQCVVIEPECEYNDPGITYEELRGHGLKAGPICKRKITDTELVSFLNQYDNTPGNITDWFNEDDEELLSDEEEKVIKDIDNSPLKGEDKRALVNVRINQGIFRERLLKHNPNKCCLCDVESPQLLIASHIKPWSKCEEEERLDKNNGFLMCPSHDKLFDRHLITFDDDGSIRISDYLTENDRKGMGIKPGMRIKLTEGNKKYLEHHRKMFECNKT